MKVTLLSKSNVAPRLILFSDLVENMRSEKTAKKTGIFRDQLKKLLPGETLTEAKKMPLIFFSSLYKKQKEGIQWMEYTGWVLTELKELSGRREAETLRQKAADCLPTVLAFVGSSGRSIKIVSRFTRPDGSLPGTRHEAECFHAHAYRKAVDFYGMQLDRQLNREKISMDSGGRLSFDPELYYNPHALPIVIGQPLEMPGDDPSPAVEKGEIKDSWEKILPGEDRRERIAFLFDVALRETLLKGGEQLENDREAFLVQLAENCFRSGIPEEEAVKRIRLYSRLEVHEECLRITIRNVYLMEKGFGERTVIPVVQLLALQLEEFLSRRYELRRNILKKNVEYRQRAALFSRFYPVTDEVLNTISLQAHLEGLNFWDRDVKRYICSNRITPYNPIEDYLDSLPVWDGQDHIGRLVGTLPTDNPHWPLCFYRWFLAMVAQWKGMNRMHGNCVVPLLSGEQATGKSSWCKHLLPPELRDYYTESIDMTARRNAEQALNRFALINLDEFDSIPAAKQPLLKHLLQLPEVTLRRLHSSQTEVLPRYASFIATCNPLDVLTDPTGSRRFLCVEVKGRISQEQFIDYSQLYAQALTALRRGERYWFDSNEEWAMTHYNEAFSQMSPEEQLLLRHFRPVGETDKTGEWLPAIEIFTRLQQLGGVKAGRTTMTSFGRILKKHDFIRKHTNSGNLYKVMVND